VSYGIISLPSSRVTVLLELSTDVTVCFQVSLNTNRDKLGMDGRPTVPIRSVVPNLILRSAGVRHSSLDASVMSALLNFVLKRVGLLISNGVTKSSDTPVYRRMRLLGDDRDWCLEPVLRKVRFLFQSGEQ
jgi:hypothetical protein